MSRSPSTTPPEPPAGRRLTRRIRLFPAGAPPSPPLIARLADLTFEVDHVYGLTEVYGPFTIAVPAPGEERLPPGERAARQARQGFANACAGEVRVVDDEMNDVAVDGRTMGEVVMRGNVVMLGYFRDPEATAKAFQSGWFHSGDLAVRHPDGAIELRDRKKDIIISGGENISTIEVEPAVVSHPAGLEAAVIAGPDAKWGEVPKGFGMLAEGEQAAAGEMIR